MAMQSPVRLICRAFHNLSRLPGTCQLSFTVQTRSAIMLDHLVTPKCSLFTSGNNGFDGCNSPESSAILLTTPSKHIAHIEFNKPKVKNAFGLDSAKQMIETLSFLEDDSSIRCVLLSGNGPDFTSGVDIKSFMSTYASLQETDDSAKKAKILLKTCEQFQAPFKKLYSFVKPIICIHHGLCFGLGMELAACSDIRYCTKDAKMSIREVLIGIAADVGSLQLMPRLVANQSLLRELIYTGRNLTVDEAVVLGFVSRVCETKDEAIKEALKTAETIASRSPVAVQGSKRNLRLSSDKSFLDGLEYNAIWNMAMMQSEDVAKAISAILNKSKDVYFEDF